MLRRDNLVLMAADAVDGSAVTPGTMITVCLNSGTRDEIRGYYEQFSAGATITAPIQEEFFGMYASLTDKFGVNWMVNCDAPHEADKSAAA